MPLERDDLALPVETHGVFGVSRELRLVTDDGLFLTMLLGCQRRDGAGRLCDGQLELESLLNELRERLAFATHALTQFLDLALGLQNATRFGLCAAGKQVRTSKHVAVERGHACRRLARHADGPFEAVRDVRLGQHLPKSRDIGSGQTQDVG